MKWLIFTGACVAILVALGVLAVDERDVEWEGRQAVCPYCRTALKPGALVCQACNRSFDWVPHQETCRWCLTRDDAEYLRDLFDELQLEEGPLPGPLGVFQSAYFNSMDAGTCTYCGGSGQPLQGSAKVTCPVCRDDRRCVGCGGDHLMTVGDLGARKRKLEREKARREATRIAELTGQPLKRALLTERDIEALRGHAESETLVDEQGRPLLQRARERMERAFRLLREAVERRRAEAGAGGPTGS